MLIGICGLIGSGKGSVADYLVEKHNFTKLSYADKLKDGIAAIFDLDRELLEGETTESRFWREQPLEQLSKEFGYTIKPRDLLQKIGTEAFRKTLHNDIWVILTKLTIQANPDINYVIPDVRFYNEQELVKQCGGQLWQIRRGDLPSWWDVAITDNQLMLDEMLQYNIHESEYKWVRDDSYFNKIITNNASLDDLYKKVALYV